MNMEILKNYNSDRCVVASSEVVNKQGHAWTYSFMTRRHFFTQ